MAFAIFSHVTSGSRFARAGDGVDTAKFPRPNLEWSCRARARTRAEHRNAAPSVITMAVNCVQYTTRPKKLEKITHLYAFVSPTRNWGRRGMGGSHDSACGPND